jgi:hypothetical protein
LFDKILKNGEFNTRIPFLNNPGTYQFRVTKVDLGQARSGEDRLVLVGAIDKAATKDGTSEDLGQSRTIMSMRSTHKDAKTIFDSDLLTWALGIGKCLAAQAGVDPKDFKSEQVDGKFLEQIYGADSQLVGCTVQVEVYNITTKQGKTIAKYEFQPLSEDRKWIE